MSHFVPLSGQASWCAVISEFWRKILAQPKAENKRPNYSFSGSFEWMVRLVVPLWLWKIFFAIAMVDLHVYFFFCIKTSFIITPSLRYWENLSTLLSTLQAEISNSKNFCFLFSKNMLFLDIFIWNFTKTNGNFDRN